MWFNVRPTPFLLLKKVTGQPEMKKIKPGCTTRYAGLSFPIVLCNSIWPSDEKRDWTSLGLRRRRKKRKKEEAEVTYKNNVSKLRLGDKYIFYPHIFNEFQTSSEN